MNFATKWSRNTSMPFPTMPTLSRDSTERATSSASHTNTRTVTHASTAPDWLQSQKREQGQRRTRGVAFLSEEAKKKMPS